MLFFLYRVTTIEAFESYLGRLFSVYSLIHLLNVFVVPNNNLRKVLNVAVVSSCRNYIVNHSKLLWAELLPIQWRDASLKLLIIIKRMISYNLCCFRLVPIIGCSITRIEYLVAFEGWTHKERCTSLACSTGLLGTHAISLISLTNLYLWVVSTVRIIFTHQTKRSNYCFESRYLSSCGTSVSNSVCPHNGSF